jgi:hypothetical protein
MGSFEYLVSSQKRCVVKVSTDGAATTFGLTASAWGGITGFNVPSNEWTMPKASDIQLSQVMYGLSGPGALLSFGLSPGGVSLTAFNTPSNSDGHIAFERCPIPFSTGGNNITGANFTVTSTANPGVVIMEFIR